VSDPSEGNDPDRETASIAPTRRMPRPRRTSPPSRRSKGAGGYLRGPLRPSLRIRRSTVLLAVVFLVALFLSIQYPAAPKGAVPAGYKLTPDTTTTTTVVTVPPTVASTTTTTPTTTSTSVPPTSTTSTTAARSSTTTTRGTSPTTTTLAPATSTTTSGVGSASSTTTSTSGT
jgi:hypothetical protein